MLDIMRRQKRLKLVLWVVIFALAIGMLLFFVPGTNMGDVTSESYAARVDDKTISMRDFAKAYNRVVENYSRGGGSIPNETLVALGVPGQVLDGLINNKIVEIIGERFGLEVTPAEIRQAIESMEVMQDPDGGFIGIEGYKQVLAANRYSIEEFEEEVRFAQLLKKVRAVITDSLEVSDRELRDEFSRATRQTVVEYVYLDKNEFKKRIKPSESELRAYFDEHQETYRIPEKRRVEYLLVRDSQLLPNVTVTESDLREEWNRRPHEETVEASHILFAVSDQSKEAEIRAKAEAVLKQAKEGADFAELAKKNSDDSGSASQGGALGPFQRGQMVPEFENAAFALKPGEISDLVRTEYGYHIIKVTRHEIPTFEANRESLTAAVQSRKAHELAKQKAEEAAAAAQKQKDLAAAGKGLGFQVEINQSGLFTRTDSPYSVGLSQQLIDEVFLLKDVNSIGKAVEHPLGYAVPKLLEVQLAKPGDFTVARKQVEADYLEAEAKEMIQAEAKKLSEEAKKQGSLEKAAKAAGFTMKTTEPFSFNGTPSQEIGSNPQFNQTAFDLEPGSVSDPVSLLDNAAVLRVKSRTPFDEEAFKKQQPELRQRLLQALQDPFFQDYVTKVANELVKQGKIKRNQSVLERPLAAY